MKNFGVCSLEFPLPVAVKSLYLKDNYIGNALEFAELLLSSSASPEILSDLNRSYLRFKLNDTVFWIDLVSRDVVIVCIETSTSIEDAARDVYHFIKATLPAYKTKPSFDTIDAESIVICKGSLDVQSSTPLEFLIDYEDQLFVFYIFDLVRDSYLIAEMW